MPKGKKPTKKAAKKAAKKPAKPKKEEVIKHRITKQDIENNPGIENDVKVGDVVEIPVSAIVTSFPVFEGVQVVEVVQPDVNGKWHRCRMVDGTTRDVPRELFPSNA